MKVLLDQGLPRRAAQRLRELGWSAQHVGEVGLSHATDSEILVEAAVQCATVVTLDADFHMLLALSGAKLPSVVRLRLQGLGADAFVELLLELAPRFADAARAGALITINALTLRIQRLPIVSKMSRESL